MKPLETICPYRENHLCEDARTKYCDKLFQHCWIYMAKRQLEEDKKTFKKVVIQNEDADYGRK